MVENIKIIYNTFHIKIKENYTYKSKSFAFFFFEDLYLQRENDFFSMKDKEMRNILYMNIFLYMYTIYTLYLLQSVIHSLDTHSCSLSLSSTYKF